MKPTLTLLTLFCSPILPCMAGDYSGRGRLSDIPGYHDSGNGWVVLVIIVVGLLIINKMEEKR